MTTRLVGTACAVLILAGCGSTVGQQSQALIPHPSIHSFASSGQLPSPHLLTSINSADVLNITPAQAAPFLTIGHANSGPTESASYESAGIDAIPYTDINHYIPNDNSGTNKSLTMSDVALTCDGQPVQWNKPNHPLMYLTDPRNPATVAAWEQWYTNFVAAGGQAWATFEDTSDDPFTYAYPAPPCNAAGTGVVSQSEWTTAEQAQEGAMQAYSGKPVFFNGLAAGYNKQMPPANALLDGPVAGGEMETCAPQNTTEWLNQVAIEIHAVQKQKYFVCHNEDNSDGSTPQAIAFRNYQFATMMLDYDLAHTVYESYFAVGSSALQVQPESEVVMENPIKTTINAATDLLKSGGSYVRRYKTCYVAGVVVGGCAVVVNPTSATVSYPFGATAFHHTMLLQGSGVYDGATVSAQGPAPATTVAAYSGEVVFP
jgi:hypothetical protein